MRGQSGVPQAGIRPWTLLAARHRLALNFRREVTAPPEPLASRSPQFILQRGRVARRARPQTPAAGRPSPRCHQKQVPGRFPERSDSWSHKRTFTGKFSNFPIIPAFFRFRTGDSDRQQIVWVRCQEFRMPFVSERRRCSRLGRPPAAHQFRRHVFFDDFAFLLDREMDHGFRDMFTTVPGSNAFTSGAIARASVSRRVGTWGFHEGSSGISLSFSCQFALFKIDLTLCHSKIGPRRHGHPSRVFRHLRLPYRSPRHRNRTCRCNLSILQFSYGSGPCDHD